MIDLKTKIARGEYKIDSRDVAEAILSKMRTVNRVRAQIEGDSAEQPNRPVDAFSAWSRDRRRAAF